jgi:hypothetical protein
LSPEWFDELGAAKPRVGTAPGAPDRACAPDLVVRVPDLVVRVVVTAVPDAPDAQVHYQVAVTGLRAVVLSGVDASWTAPVVLSADYATVAGIASGELSALDAMSSGRARITGNTATLTDYQSVLEALDLVPPSVRVSTSF